MAQSLHEVLFVTGGPAVTLSSFFIHWRHIFAVILFFWASYHQYSCHTILANLRKTKRSTQQSRGKGNDNHQTVQGPRARERLQSAQNLYVGIPVGDWFEFVSCPHYLAEVLIYCSLVLVEWRSVAMLLPCVFVTCVLALSAHQMHGWYCSKFNDYPRNRNRIIPYLF